MKYNTMIESRVQGFTLPPFTRKPWGEGDDEAVLAAARQREMDDKIAEGIAKATAGLETKNRELLDEVKKSRDVLKTLGEMGGVDEVKKLHDLFSSNEEMKLLKEGKVEEVVAKRLDKEKAKYETQLSELKTQNEQLQSSSQGFQTKYQTKVVEDHITQAAIAAGVRKEALGDVVMRARGVFRVGDDDEVEARDSKGNLVKIEDALLTPALYVENLKKSHPHYWPGSKGSNAGGDGDGESTDLFRKAQAAAASGDMKVYRETRDKMNPANKK